MTFDRRYLNSFLDSLMNEGMHKKIEWVCNSRVDGSDLVLFNEMKSAGCWQVAFGYVFGDERILQLADKGARPLLSREEPRLKRLMKHNTQVTQEEG